MIEQSLFKALSAITNGTIGGMLCAAIVQSIAGGSNASKYLFVGSVVGSFFGYLCSIQPREQ